MSSCSKAHPRLSMQLDEEVGKTSNPSQEETQPSKSSLESRLKEATRLSLRCIISICRGLQWAQGKG